MKKARSILEESLKKNVGKGCDISFNTSHHLIEEPWEKTPNHLGSKTGRNGGGFGREQKRPPAREGKGEGRKLMRWSSKGTPRMESYRGLKIFLDREKDRRRG